MLHLVPRYTLVTSTPMSAKQTILTAIRRHQLADAPLPNLDADWIEFPDVRKHFANVLESVGGRAIFVSDMQQLKAQLAMLPAWADAKKTTSAVTEVSGSVDLNSLTNPHATEDIDFAVIPGEFAVAENGAVWTTESRVKHRAVYFIAQHLALVVPAHEVLSNMHQAYRRLKFDSPQFGAFISGPSKTADIEQSLVIGAHGPRSMTVFLVG